MQLVAIIGVIGFLILAASGIFYETGTSWYHSCWQRVNDFDGWVAPKPSSPEESAAWQQCEPIAIEGTNQSGVVFTNFPIGETDIRSRKIEKACPNIRKDFPLLGWHIKVVKIIESGGGTTFRDKLYPASSTVQHAIEKEWPNCRSILSELGYPRLKKTGNVWDWETPCPKCKHLIILN